MNDPVARPTPDDLVPTTADDAAPAEVDGRSARWTEHRASRREELIDAALRAVAESGVDVGMDQIAQTAHTSKPVIYRYFADKNELHRAMGERIIGNIVAALARVEPAADGAAGDRADAPQIDDPRIDDPRAMMRASIDAYLQLLEDHPELFRFVTQNRVLNEAGPAEFNSPVAGLLTATLADQLRRLGLDPVGAQPWGEAIVGFIRAASLWWIEHPEAMTRTQLAEYLGSLLWGGAAGVYQSAGREVDGRIAPGIFAPLPGRPTS